MDKTITRVIQIKEYLNISETRQKLSTLWDFYITDDEYTDKPFLNSIWYINNWKDDNFISIFLNSNGKEIHLKTSDWVDFINKYIGVITKLVNN